MKWRILLSSVAFLFATTILVVSLSSIEGVRAGESNMTSKRLYLGRVLPDHTFYPVLMALDRLQLETASPTERIYLQLDYANRRLYYTQELLTANDPEKQAIALTTLTKAEKYLIQAVKELESLEEVDESLEQHVTKTLKFHYKELEKLIHRFPDYQRSPLDQLKEEERNLLESL